MSGRVSPVDVRVLYPAWFPGASPGSPPVRASIARSAAGTPFPCGPRALLDDDDVDSQLTGRVFAGDAGDGIFGAGLPGRRHSRHAGKTIVTPEPRMPSSTRRRIPISAARKCVYSLLTTAAAFALIELSCRLSPFGAWRNIADLHRDPDSPNAITVDPVLHHVWTPSFREIDTRRGIRYERVVNSQSWVEDYDVSRQKPDGCYRVFYVGDSNTEGVVPAGLRMVDIVERRLNEVYGGSGLTFEVINTGTSSYSPILYFLLIRTRILPYAPDLIVINVDMTDAVNDAAYSAFALREAGGGLISVTGGTELPGDYRMTPRGLVKMRPVDKLAEWVVAHSAFCRNLHMFLRGPVAGVDYVEAPDAIDADWLAHEWSPACSENVARTMRYLGQTAKLLRDGGVKLVVTGVPHYYQYTGKWSTRPHRELGAAAEQYGFAYFNSYELLKPDIEGTALERYYWATDPTHLNAAGNERWAEVQLSVLLDPKRDLLPSLAAGRSGVGKTPSRAGAGEPAGQR